MINGHEVITGFAFGLLIGGYFFLRAAVERIEKKIDNIYCKCNGGEIKK